MKRRNRVIAALIALNVVTAVNIPSFSAKAADVDYAAVESLVNLAADQSSFYYYNLAYAKIIDLPEGDQKQILLSKLAATAGTIWTEDISKIVQSFEIIAKEKSGREYDAAEAKIEDSALKQVDKDYLYSELYSWGKDRVWTEDYKAAVAGVVELWNAKTEEAAVKAYKAVSELKLQINKDYLKELFREANASTTVNLLILDSEYFDGTENADYKGAGKSAYVDLSADSKEREITLKDAFKNLYINAPKATVKLDSVTAVKLSLEDVSAESLYLTGNTKVEKILINDKDNNAHIVLQGQATIGEAEIASGALIEVNVDNDVKNPFGKLILSSGEKITLKGDFKDSEVQYTNKGEIVIEGTVNVLVIPKEAAGAKITIAKGAKVGEIKAEGAVTVEGEGTVTKVTGSAAGDVVNNTTPPTTGGGSGGGSGSQSYSYKVTVTHNDGTPKPIVPSVSSSTKISEIYDAAIGLAEDEPSAISKIENIIGKLQDIQLADGTTLFEYATGILKTGPFADIDFNDPNAIAAYLFEDGNDFEKVYADINSVTGWNITVPELGGTLTVKINNEIQGSTFNLRDVLDEIGFEDKELKDITVKDLYNADFDVEVSYGEKKYSVKAEDNTITFTTVSGDIYTVKVTRK